MPAGVQCGSVAQETGIEMFALRLLHHKTHLIWIRIPRVVVIVRSLHQALGSLYSLGVDIGSCSSIVAHFAIQKWEQISGKLRRILR